jgi:hypothetical protein
MNKETSYNKDSLHSPSLSDKQIRKIQTIHGNSTFILVVPKDFISELGIEKGDYVTCAIEQERIVITKVRM